MRPQRTLIVVIGICLTLGVLGCGGRDDGTMPITTSSDAARREYIEGRALLEKLRAQEAIPHLERAVKADPGFAMAHLMLANAHQTPKEFFASFNRAVSLLDNVSKGEQLVILATQAGVNGDSRKQKELFERLVELYPRDVRVAALLGNYYFGQQDYERAVAQYQKAEQIDPEYSPIFNQMGYAYRYLGQYDKAEEAFQRYTSLIPDDPNPYDSYAELLLKSGKFDKAIETYHKALEISPDFVFSHLGIASALLLQGHADSARQQLRTMLETSANDGRRRQALTALAASFIDEGNFDSALVYLERQLDLGRASHDSSAMSGDLLLLTSVHIEMGDFDTAERLLEKAGECIRNADVSDQVKENSALNGYYFGARIAVGRGDFATARKLHEEYAAWARRTQNPGLARVSHELSAIIALAERRYEAAITDLKQANLHSPYNLYRLGQAYEGLGNMIEARSWYHKAAHFNETISPTYAYVRQKALAREAALSSS